MIAENKPAAPAMTSWTTGGFAAAQPGLSVGSEPDGPPESGRHASTLVLLRYVLIAAAAYLLLFEGKTSSPTLIAAIIAVALLSNVLLAHVPEERLIRPATVGALVCFDIAWIAFGLWYGRETGDNIFFLYFFVLFLAAMGQNVLLIAGAGALIGLVDLAILVGPSQLQSGWTSPSLIRVPFIFTTALFYGYLTERWKHEHRWAIVEKEFAHKLSQIVREQTQDLQRLYEQAKAQAAELERANRVKSEFLSIMSHELRTPLSIMMGYSGLIKDKTMGEITPHQEKMLRKVLNHGLDLLSMINSIMQATTMESQTVKLACQEVNLKEFIADLKLFYGVSFNEDVGVVWDCDSGLPAVNTDPAKLRQILQNLINNAIKFTEKGQVTISARLLEGRQQAGGPSTGLRAGSSADTQHPTPNTRFLELKVADTGIGIAPEVLPTIFDLFHQADNSLSRSYGGLGMGLYVVKKLTEFMGGAVEVESTPGVGSTFTVTIPTTPTPTAHGG
jgi:signal transduction histidine kinase